MSRFVVQGIHREGHNGSFRLGRRWPADKATEIEVLDQDEDPKADDAKKGDAQKKAEEAGVPVYGRKSFERLRADAFLKVVNAGDPLALGRANDDVEALKAENARLTEENRQLRERLGEGTGEGREPPAPSKKKS